MNHQDLESWAERAAQELQELADELEESGSDPSAVRVLIDEYEAICQGRPVHGSPTLDELATAQGVKPMTDARSLFETWPGDDSEDDVDDTGPIETLFRRSRLGLANSPDDCANQLALLADAMAATAQGMSWVSQYADDVDQEMRAELKKHALELDLAARTAESWANAIVRA